MSNNSSNKQKIADEEGARIKLSATNSRSQRSVKNNEQAMAMATSAARKQGGGANKTSGANRVQP